MNIKHHGPDFRRQAHMVLVYIRARLRFHAGTRLVYRVCDFGKTMLIALQSAGISFSSAMTLMRTSSLELGMMSQSMVIAQLNTTVHPSGIIHMK